MALVIETGAIVPGAESFASAAELVAYAANFGRVIPADTTAQEALLRRAALEMDAKPWKGRTVNRDQALAWPRMNVCRNGFTLPSDSIPAQIKAGQMALATEIHADDLSPPEQRLGAISREKVGPLETEYSTASPIISKPAAVRQSYAQFSGLLQSSSQVSLSRS
ncbi:DnaT-like ssDNA-binding protein [Pseudomonas sp. SDO55104_S430]